MIKWIRMALVGAALTIGGYFNRHDEVMPTETELTEPEKIPETDIWDQMMAIYTQETKSTPEEYARVCRIMECTDPDSEDAKIRDTWLLSKYRSRPQDETGERGINPFKASPEEQETLYDDIAKQRKRNARFNGVRRAYKVLGNAFRR